MTETDERERGRGPWLGCLVAGMLLFPPAYLLAPGPLLWLQNRGYLGESAGIIFKPLELAYSNSSAVARFYDWYLTLWQ
jgi:hypothetical protein